MNDDIFNLERAIQVYFEDLPEEQLLLKEMVNGYMPKMRYIGQFDKDQVAELKTLYQQLSDCHDAANTPLQTQCSKVPVFPEDHGEINHFKITSDDAYKVITFKHDELILLNQYQQYEDQSDDEFAAFAKRVKNEYQNKFGQPIVLKTEPNQYNRLTASIKIKCVDLLSAIGQDTNPVTIRQRSHSGTQLTLTCHYMDGSSLKFAAFRVVLSRHYPIINLTGVPRKKRKDAGKNRQPIIFDGERILPEYWIVPYKAKR